MKTIAFIIPDLSVGGAQRSLVKLTNILVDNHHNVTILCMGSAANVIRTELSPKVQLMCFEARRSADLKLFIRLWQTIRQLRLDTLVGWSMYANFFAVVLGRIEGVRTVMISERNYPIRMIASPENTRLRRSLLWLLVRILYPMADVVTANSERTVRFLRRFLHRRGARFEQLPNVFEPKFYELLANQALELPLPEPTNGPRILAIGRLHPQKGFDLLLEAIAALPPTQPWELVLAGEGPHETALRSQIERLRLNSRVHLIGPIENPFPLYRWADLVVVPSRYEGFPNVPLEAMGVGAAVIVSNCETGPRELTVNGTYALLVPNGDVLALTDAISALGGSLHQARLLGAAAQRHVQATYGLERIEAVYLAMFSR